MDIKITPRKLSGSFTAPPSKSYAHRAIIAAALSKGSSVISPIVLSDDMIATLGAIKAIGADYEITGNKVTVSGISEIKKQADIDCFESGSALRFYLPIVAALGINTKFSGKGKLPCRPLSPLKEELIKHGAVIEHNGTMPFTVGGKITSGKYFLAGNISSQYITGLLFSLPLLSGDSEIIITTETESQAYIDMTIQTLSAFKIKIEKTDNGYFIKGNQKYISNDYTVEGDYSNAAFFLTAGAIFGKITALGLNKNSLQGDAEILNLLSRLGANIEWLDNTVIAEHSELNGIEIDAKNIPDIIPILAVAAALSKGKTIIKNAARLKIKECDRLNATTNNLFLLGADITATEDGLIINGKEKLKGGVTVNGENDHRIVMLLAIAANFCEEPVIIKGAEAINKTYPDFFEKFSELGGKFNVI